jgi:hypothetical protein
MYLNVPVKSLIYAILAVAIGALVRGRAARHERGAGGRYCSLAMASASPADRGPGARAVVGEHGGAVVGEHGGEGLLDGADQGRVATEAGRQERCRVRAPELFTPNRIDQYLDFHYIRETAVKPVLVLSG